MIGQQKKIKNIHRETFSQGRCDEDTIGPVLLA